MHPIFYVIGALFLLNKNGGAAAAGGVPTNVLGSIQAQLAANKTALDKALAAAQKAAAAKAPGGGSGASGGPLGASTPTGSILGGPVSQWLAATQTAAGQDVFQVTNVDPGGSIDSVAAPDPYSFTPDAADQTLMILDSNAQDAAQSSSPDYTDGSGLTDSLESVTPDYQAPTMDFPLGDSSADSGSDYVDGSSIYNGDGIFIDPSMGDATGYDGWDYGGD